MADVGYVHLRTKEYGCVTVAFDKSGDHGPMERDIGLAYCSPCESFSKKKGRSIAEGRLSSDAWDMSHVMSANNSSAIMDGVCSLMQEIYDEYQDYLDRDSCDDDYCLKYPEPNVPRWFVLFWDEYKERLIDAEESKEGKQCAQ